MILLRTLLLQLVAVPLCFLLGKALSGGISANWRDVSLLLGKAFFFFCGLHVLLVWPLFQFARCDISEIKNEVAQFFIYAVLLFLPLNAFAFLNANVKNWVDVYELLLCVGPASVIGALWFSKVEKPFEITLLLTVPIFVSLYVVSEIASPFATYIQVLSDGNYLLFLRTFFSATAICFVFFSLPWESKNCASADFLILAGLSVPLVQGLKPFLAMGMGVKEIELVPFTDIFWIGLVLVGLFRRVKVKAADLFVRIWSLGFVVYALYVLTQRVHFGDSTFRDFHTFFLCYMSVIFLSYFAFQAPSHGSSIENALSRQKPVAL